MQKQNIMKKSFFIGLDSRLRGNDGDYEHAFIAAMR
jgi:hypothetical protein